MYDTPTDAIADPLIISLERYYGWT